MKKNQKNMLIASLIVIIIALLGIVISLLISKNNTSHVEDNAHASYQKSVNEANSSMDAASSSETNQKKTAFSKKLAKAPEGHYVHLGKDATTVYKTTWTKQQVIDYVEYLKKWRQDNPTIGYEKEEMIKKDFGTGDSSLPLGAIRDDIERVLHPKSADHSQTDFKFYFNSPKDVAKDKDVQENATELKY